MQSVKVAASGFLANKRIAVTGVSRASQAHGSNNVLQEAPRTGLRGLRGQSERRRGRGDPCYQDLKSIPGGVDAVVIGTRPELAEDTMRECSDLGIQRVWMHRGQVKRFGRRNGLRPAARHHGDRRRLPPDVRADLRLPHRLMRFVYAGHVRSRCDLRSSEERSTDG